MFNIIASLNNNFSRPKLNLQLALEILTCTCKQEQHNPNTNACKLYSGERFTTEENYNQDYSFTPPFHSTPQY